MCLNIFTVIEFSLTSELVFTNRLRCVNESCFRFFNLFTFFVDITSYFQLRNVILRRITRDLVFDWRVHVRCNTVFLSSTSSIFMVTNRLTRRLIAFLGFDEFLTFFIHVTCDFQLRNIILWSIPRKFITNWSVYVSSNSTLNVCPTCIFVITDCFTRSV